MAYEDANEVVVVGSFGTVRRTPEQRQEYLDFHEVPPALVAGVGCRRGSEGRGMIGLE